MAVDHRWDFCRRQGNAIDLAGVRSDDRFAGKPPTGGEAIAFDPIAAQLLGALVIPLQEGMLMVGG